MSPWFGILLALAAATTWAIAPVLYRRAVESMSYITVNAVRCIGFLLSAALYLLVTMGPQGFLVVLPPKAMLLTLSTSILWLVLGDLLYLAAIHRLGVSICVPFTSSYPLIVMPAAWLVLGEPLQPIIAMSAVAVVAGLVLLAPREEGAYHGAVRSGLVMAFVAMCCWTVGILATRVLMLEIPIPLLEWWRAVGVCAASWILFFLRESPRVLQNVPKRAIIEVIVAGVLGLTLGDLFYTYSMQGISVTMATCIASVRPFLAALFAWLVLREKLSARKVWGIALVAGGVMLMSS